MIHLLGISTLVLYLLALSLTGLSYLECCRRILPQTLVTHSLEKVAHSAAFLLLVIAVVLLTLQQPLGTGIFYLWVAVLLDGALLFRSVRHPVAKVWGITLVLVFLASSSYLVHLHSLGADSEARSLLLYLHVALAALAEVGLIVAALMATSVLRIQGRLRRKEMVLIQGEGESLKSSSRLTEALLKSTFALLTAAILLGLSLNPGTELLLDVTFISALLIWFVTGAILHPRFATAFGQRAKMLGTILLAAVSLLLLGIRVSAGDGKTHRSGQPGLSHVVSSLSLIGSKGGGQ